MDFHLKYNVRPGIWDDMAAVAEMIQELADLEKMPNGPKLSVADLQRDGFETQPPAFKCFVAETESRVIGYALYFPTYSTWEGRSMMLEDLYVRREERRDGVGQLLFNTVAKEAVSSHCARVDFHVLKWNPARSFYDRNGAINLTETEDWCYYRLTGGPLQEAAKRIKEHPNISA